jgi:hypothetical protein
VHTVIDDRDAAASDQSKQTQQRRCIKHACAHDVDASQLQMGSPCVQLSYGLQGGPGGSQTVSFGPITDAFQRVADGSKQFQLVGHASRWVPDGIQIDFRRIPHRYTDFKWIWSFRRITDRLHTNGSGIPDGIQTDYRRSPDGLLTGRFQRHFGFQTDLTRISDSTRISDGFQTD